MDVKLGTKTWTEHSDRTPVSQSVKEKNISAQDQKQLMGGKDLDQVLNEIADPKYVDPSKMRKPQGKMDKDAFLKLMLTQLKYQDPMNPMQSHEMAAQLAQFSSLEQLSNIDNSIQGLKKSQDPMVNFQALNFIGKSISADTEKIVRAKGDTVHDMRFQLPQEAKEVILEIKDDSGAVVKTIKAQNLKKGENKITWNGTKEDGYPTYAGTYTFSVKGITNSGAQFTGRTSFGGVVTGLNYSPEGPILMIGDQKVRLSDVKKIEDQNERMAQDLREQQGTTQGAQAKTESPAQNTVAQPQTGAKVQVKQEEKSQDKSIDTAAQDRPKGNINMVPMSDDLRNVVAKETNLKS